MLLTTEPRERRPNPCIAVTKDPSSPLPSGDADPPEWVDPRATPFVEPVSRGRLPHLYKESGTYFVTFRLHDAVATRPARPFRPRSAREVAERSEPPLLLGSCALGRPEVAEVVARSLLHFDAERYRLHAWCVMPNHVHVVLSAFKAWSVPKILHSWKSFTAKQAHRILGGSGAFWEREWFDHLIRSTEDVDRFVRYTEENPVAAGLCQEPWQWPYSSARRNRASE